MNEPEREVESMEEPAATTSHETAEETAAAPEASPHLVNVAEAIRYRKRAQAAEKELAELRTQLEETQDQSRAVQNRLTEVERRAAIDAQLVEAGVADLQAARLLVEAAMGETDGVEIDEVVAVVRRERPQLFRSTTSHATAAMGPAVHAVDHGSRDIQRAANAARRSGHNADVMHYMNLRRSAPR